MAKLVTFTHPRNGTVYTGAYCALNIIEINRREAIARFRFDIWASPAANQTGLELVHDSGFEVTGADFLAGMTAEMTLQKSISTIAYDFAATRLHVNQNDSTSPLLFEGSTDA